MVERDDFCFCAGAIAVWICVFYLLSWLRDSFDFIPGKRTLELFGIVRISGAVCHSWWRARVMTSASACLGLVRTGLQGVALDVVSVRIMWKSVLLLAAIAIAHQCSADSTVFQSSRCFSPEIYKNRRHRAWSRPNATRLDKRWYWIGTAIADVRKCAQMRAELDWRVALSE